MSHSLPDFALHTPWGSTTAAEPLPGAAAGELLELAREHDSVVLGLLAFSPEDPDLLMVPSRWERTPAAGTETASPQAGAGQGPRPAARPVAQRGLDSPGYRRAVGRALERLHAGDLDKVVLARTLELDYAAQAPLEPAAVLASLRRQHPRAYVFSVADPSTDPAAPAYWMGASPELVASVRDGVLTTHPLAGSASRADAADPTEDLQIGEQLLRSPKDRAEHATVVEDIAARLRPLCEVLEVPAAPSLLATPQLWHLGTRITGRLRPGVTALDAARAIHPTPAICGSPRREAQQLIGELEEAPRGFFGGLVGWTDPAGNGEWALNLRSARLGPRGATLFAGAGIVTGSTPEGEHRETGTKLSTFLAALGLAPEDLADL